MKYIYRFLFCVICFIGLCHGAIADGPSCEPGFGLENGECYPCERGHYSSGGEGAQCIECEAGKYSNTAAATSCQNCPAGTYSGQPGAYSCVKCPAGGYSLAGSSSCTECQPGEYSYEGASSCRNCPPGTYSTETGSASCTKCPAGKYSTNVGAASASVCLSCPLRTYSEAGATSCETCPAGSCCALGIAYRCVKGTWSPGNELCKATQYHMNEVAMCQSGRGVENSSNDNQPKGATNNRGMDDDPTGGDQPGGGSGGGGNGGGCSVIEDLSVYKNGVCLHECAGACTTASVGAASESYCTVKTIKTFKYNNGSKIFKWPQDGSVSEQSIKTSASLELGSIHCPAQ